MCRTALCSFTGTCVSRFRINDPLENVQHRLTLPSTHIKKLLLLLHLGAGGVEHQLLWTNGGNQIEIAASIVLRLVD